MDRCSSRRKVGFVTELEPGEFVIGHDHSGFVTVEVTHRKGKLTPASARRIAAALDTQAQVAEFLGGVD